MEEERVATLADPVDMTFQGFVELIFKNPLQDPFSYSFSFLDDLTVEQRSQALGFLLVTGIRILYDKELAQLTTKEIENARKYLQSIGFDAEYTMAQKTKVVTEYTPDNKPFQYSVPYNDWQITFKSADQKLRKPLI